MELAFNRPIRDNNGDIKFPAGVFYDWPKQTFQQIAKNVGLPLDKITVSKDAAAAIVAKAIEDRQSESKPVQKPKNERLRVTKRAPKR